MSNRTNYIDRLQFSQREKTVLYLVAQNKKNREIAEVLNVTEGTVSNYVSKIRDKIESLHGVHITRARLPEWARKNGYKQ